MPQTQLCAALVRPWPWPCLALRTRCGHCPRPTWSGAADWPSARDLGPGACIRRPRPPPCLPPTAAQRSTAQHVDYCSTAAIRMKMSAAADACCARAARWPAISGSAGRVAQHNTPQQGTRVLKCGARCTHRQHAAHCVVDNGVHCEGHQLQGAQRRDFANGLSDLQRGGRRHGKSGGSS